MKSLKEKAFAKINLGLRVFGRYPDGYHEINTLMVKINLHDIITIEPSQKMTVECDADLGIPETDNIAFKAAQYFLEHIGRAGDCFKISIKKKIPAGAGLGGGSADAAAVITAMMSYYGIMPGKEELLKICMKLGSDVPFFLFSNSAIAQGRGEILQEVNLNLPFWFLLVFPGIIVSTKRAYEALPEPATTESGLDLFDIVKKGLKDNDYLRKYLVNDFEKVVFEKYPVLKEIKSKMYSRGAVSVQLSGSGSTVYGMFETKEKAASAAHGFSGFQCFICRQLINTE